MTVLHGPAHESVAAGGLLAPVARCLFWAAAAVAIAGSAAAAEPDEPRSDSSTITEPLLARIEQQEARGGPFSPELIELFMALGLAYQEYGDHALAIATLDHALYLMRFNGGLHTLDQAPLLERLIASQLEMGQEATAKELRQRLLELARRNMGDPRSVPIFRAEADREMDIYEGYLTGELHPPFTITINGADSNQDQPYRVVSRARGNYLAAIAASRSSGTTEPAHLAELEQALTRSYYLQATTYARETFDAGRSLTEQRGSMYAQGRASYTRRVSYLRMSMPSAADQARALIEMADWALVFSRNGKAVDGYAQAYELLVAAGTPAASIQELFPIDVPVVLPTFVANPLAAAGSADASGYIDVDFEVSRYGEARRIRVVNVSGEAAADKARRVAAAIARGRYRPRPLEDMSATPFRLRYSLADGTLTPRP